MSRVRATTVRVRDQFVLARFGKLSRERYRAAASRDLLETLTTAGDRWVDFGQFVEATELVCKLFADGDEGVSRDVGAFGAEANMGIWRSLVVRVLSPQTVMNIASGVWKHHYDGGKLVVRPEGKTGVRLRIEEFPTPHRVHCLSVEGWARRTIELGRPKRAVIVKTLCRLRGGDACEFLAEWE